jgi:hypothetical protein
MDMHHIHVATFSMYNNNSIMHKYSNKTPNQMQHAVVKFYYLLTNRPRLETHPPRHLYGNRRLRLQFERAPDDGRNDARNMLSSISVTK